MLINISHPEKFRKNKKGAKMAKKRIKDYRYNNIDKVILVQYEGGGLGEIEADLSELNVQLDSIKGMTLKQAKTLLGVKND